MRPNVYKRYLLFVRDAVDGIAEIVGNKQRAIRHLANIGRTSGGNPRFIDKALGKHFIDRIFSRRKFYAGDAITQRSAAIPRTMLGYENLIFVFI